MSQTAAGDVDNFRDIRVSCTKELPDSWKQAPHQWGHSLHRLSPFVGGFPPELAHYFIRWFTDVDQTVLDPFCGSGTTVLEAAINNRRAIGNDAFSYASTLSTAKCRPMKYDHFESFLDAKLKEAESINNRNMKLLSNQDLKVFFSDYTLDQLLRLRHVLRKKCSVESIYLQAIVCGILHGPSDMYLSIRTKDTYSGTANYVREYAKEHDLEAPEKDIRTSALRKQELAEQDEFFPWIKTQSSVIHGNARSIPYPDETADLILTSPPYMRVLDYTWNNWLRLWWLGKDRENEREKLDLTSDEQKYRKFMRASLVEMERLLKEDGTAVLVVGDVTKDLASGKQTINTARIIAEEASKQTGLNVQGVIDDAYDIDNRGYVVFNELKYNHNNANSESRVPIDRCLILTKGDHSLPSGPTIDWSREPFRD